MTAEILVTSVLSVVGAAVLTWTSTSLGLVGAAAGGPIVGTAVYLVVSLPLIVIGAFEVWLAVLLAVALGAGLLAVLHRRRRLASGASTAATFRAGAVSALLAVLVVAGAYTLNLTRVTPDSGEYLITAGWLDETGSIDGVGETSLLKRQVGTSLLHAVGQGSAIGYSPGWSPLLAVSATFSLGAIAWSALTPTLSRGWLLALIGTGTILLVTTNRFAFNLSYVNGHTLAAALLLAGVGYGWLGVTKREPLLLPVAGLALGCLTVVRAEGFIVIAIFLIPLLVQAGVPIAFRALAIVPFLGTTIVWNAFTVRTRVGNDELGVFGPVWGPVLIAICLLALVALMALTQDRGSWLGPATFTASLAGYLVLSGIRDPRTLETTLEALGANLASEGLWGSLWLLLPILVVAAFFVRSVPFDLPYAWGLANYAIAVVAFAYLRGSPYRISPDDSGNRMMMHVVFVAMLYAILATGYSLLHEREDGRGSPPDAIVAPSPLTETQ